MADLSALSNVTTTALGLSNLILVSPQKVIGYQPQQGADKTGKLNPKAPKFLFHYEGEQTVSLRSDITDHYIEDNTALQDQIALRPEIVTVQGFIGELNDIPPAALEPLKFAADKLYVMTGYTPELTTTALIAYNTAKQLYDTAFNLKESAVAAWSTITGQNEQTALNNADEFQTVSDQRKPGQTKQQLAFQQFYGYWRNRTLFTVQTPWAVFKNMALESVRAVQDADTRMITDFEISFKTVRFAETITKLLVGQITTFNKDAFSGRAKSQGATLVDLGPQTPSAASSFGDALTRTG